MTRILALVTDAWGGHGGIAQYNRDFLSAMALLPDVESIDILPRIAPESAEDIPAKIRQQPPVRGRVAYALTALRLATRKPDIVFCGHLFHGPLARLVAQYADAFLVSQLHGVEIWPQASPARLNALKKSNLILAVSRDTRARALDQTSIHPELVMVIPNTVAEDFCPGDRTAARDKFALGDAFVLLTVGRLDAREGYKGHDKVIAALPGLNPSGRPILYLIAGQGDDRARLERLARDANVSHNVRFLGQMAPADLPDLYRAADLFVMPSTGEGFGIAFLEAMASGTRALGLAVGGASDALGDGALGYIASEAEFPEMLHRAVSAPPQDPQVLAAAVAKRFGRASFQDCVGRVHQRYQRRRTRAFNNGAAGATVSTLSRQRP